MDIAARRELRGSPCLNHLLQAGRVHPRWQATWFVLSFLSLLNGYYECAEEFANRPLELNNNGGAGAAPGFLGPVGYDIAAARGF
jgi:hypothetical protein